MPTKNDETRLRFEYLDKSIAFLRWRLVSVVALITLQFFYLRLQATVMLIPDVFFSVSLIAACVAALLSWISANVLDRHRTHLMFVDAYPRSPDATFDRASPITGNLPPWQHRNIDRVLENIRSLDRWADRSLVTAYVLFVLGITLFVMSRWSTP